MIYIELVALQKRNNFSTLEPVWPDLEGISPLGQNLRSYLVIFSEFFCSRQNFDPDIFMILDKFAILPNTEKLI